MSQVPATQADMNFGQTGLEDFGASDAVLPRIKIDHKNGLWVDNLGGQAMQEMFFIPLGLVKQRVLFHHNVEDDDVPMCKSSDFKMGFPNPDAPAKKSFPWDLAGFDQNDYPADAEGNRSLPCNSCALKDWGSSPTGDTPYCSEQWTMPIYYYPDGEQGTDIAPAILTLQKSSVKPIRTYLTSFQGANKPPFVNAAKGTLKVLQRGQVVYSVPSFTKLGETDRERWLEFSEQYVDMRQFLTRPPVRETDGVQAQSNNTYNPTQAAPAQAAPAPQQAAPQGQDPWATPAPQQAVQPPAQAAPAPQATQPEAPSAPEAPPQAAPEQVAPQQTAPPTTPSAPPAGQGLPF